MENVRYILKGLKGGQAHFRCLLKMRQSLVYQVKADVRGPITVAVPGGTLMRQLDRFARHLVLGQPAVLRSLLYNVAVTVTSKKIHPAVNTAGVLMKYPVNNAHLLDELAPVHCTQETEAADAVAHRDLVSGLLLVLRLHQLLNRLSVFGEALLNPGQRKRKGRALSLQPAHKFRNKRAYHRRARSRHIRDHQNQALRVFLSGLSHQVRPIISPVTVDSVSGDPGCNAPEILNQRKTQHDGYRPQFAQIEYSDCLIGRYKTAEALRVHPTIAVRNRLQRNVINARKTG